MSKKWKTYIVSCKLRRRRSDDRLVTGYAVEHVVTLELPSLGHDDKNGSDNVPAELRRHAQIPYFLVIIGKHAICKDKVPSPPTHSISSPAFAVVLPPRQ